MVARPGRSRRPWPLFNSRLPAGQLPPPPGAPVEDTWQLRLLLTAGQARAPCRALFPRTPPARFMHTHHRAIGLPSHAPPLACPPPPPPPPPARRPLLSPWHSLLPSPALTISSLATPACLPSLPAVG